MILKISSTFAPSQRGAKSWICFKVKLRLYPMNLGR